MLPYDYRMSEEEARLAYFSTQTTGSGWCWMRICFPHKNWTVEIVRDICDYDEVPVIVQPGQNVDIEQLYGGNCADEQSYYWRPAKFS